MMERNKEDTINPAIPDSAVKVWEDGQWSVFWSHPKKSFYFKSLACPSSVLRLFQDELLILAQKPETQVSAEKNADAVMPVAEEGLISLRPRDKRQFKRFTRRCETEFKTVQGITRKGIASDFSIDGLFIRTTRPYAADEAIDILVHLPDNIVSSLQGKVMRSMNNPLGNVSGPLTKAYRNGMGVKITKKDANYLNFIRALIK